MIERIKKYKILIINLVSMMAKRKVIDLLYIKNPLTRKGGVSLFYVHQYIDFDLKI